MISPSEPRRVAYTPPKTIELPERGITCLPPWPQAIAFSDKRMENRHGAVAGHLVTGMLAISQSKTWDEREADRAVRSIREAKLATLGDLTAVPWKQWAGKLVLVAELMDVLPPDRCQGDPWHAEGQWGLILGRVWEVEPTPIMGGRGCFYLKTCSVCETLQAIDSAAITFSCRRCRTLRSEGDRPELTIKRECML